MLFCPPPPAPLWHMKTGSCRCTLKFHMDESLEFFYINWPKAAFQNRSNICTRNMSNWAKKYQAEPLPFWSKILPESTKEKIKKKRNPKIAVLNLQGTILSSRTSGRKNVLNIENTKGVIHKLRYGCSRSRYSVDVGSPKID